MENSIAATAAEIVEKALEQTPYELVDLEFKKERSGWNIIVYADKPSGLTLDDCEIITHIIDPLLDADERIGGKHDHLIVSSPGLDRPLRTTRDFERVVGRKLDIRFFVPRAGKKELTLTLLGVDEENLETQAPGGERMVLARGDIASAKQNIEF